MDTFFRFWGLLLKSPISIMPHSEHWRSQNKEKSWRFSTIGRYGLSSQPEPLVMDLPEEIAGRLNSGGCSLPKAIWKDWRMWLLLQMCRHLYKATKITKNQENRTQPKDYCKPPVNNTIRSPTKREIQEFPNEESKIIVLKMFRELYENTI